MSRGWRFFLGRVTPGGRCFSQKLTGDSFTVNSVHKTKNGELLISQTILQELKENDGNFSALGPSHHNDKDSNYRNPHLATAIECSDVIGDKRKRTTETKMWTCEVERIKEGKEIKIFGT
ncbi:hypothetical protein TNCV_1476131 [Trichonephila clavipes]|nr:hypothetical protein TNCV_1476131 [Trichonephila clavipes]